MVREASVSLVAAMAEAGQGDFNRFYDALMPILTQVSQLLMVAIAILFLHTIVVLYTCRSSYECWVLYTCREKGVRE